MDDSLLRDIERYQQREEQQQSLRTGLRPRQLEAEVLHLVLQGTIAPNLSRMRADVLCMCRAGGWHSSCEQHQRPFRQGTLHAHASMLPTALSTAAPACVAALVTHSAQMSWR